jgi:hypothetical protein
MEAPPYHRFWRPARIALEISANPRPMGAAATHLGGTESAPMCSRTFATPNVVSKAAKHARSFPLSPMNAKRVRALPSSVPRKLRSARTAPDALSAES